MNTDATRAHVDAETMAAWADRALPAEEAAAVELHLSNCDRCQEVLAALVRSTPVAGAAILPFWSRRPVQWGAAGLAAAAALVAMIWIGRPPAAPIPESTVASVPTPQAVDQLQDRAATEKPASAPAELGKQLSRSAREERRQAAANQAAPRKTEGGAAAAPLPAAVPAPQVAPPPPQPAPVPVAAPPPAVTVTAAAPVVSPIATQSVSVRPGAMYEATAMDSITMIPTTFEIIAPDPGSLASRSTIGLAGGAGGGGRGGAAKALTLTPGSTRWRVVAGTRVERSVDTGATWTALPIEPALKTPLLAGVATSPLNCWLVGREGVVLVTSDGLTFRRVSVPEAVHLTGVKAQDAMSATVTAIGGRQFTTIDGGLTWK